MLADPGPTFNPMVEYLSRRENPPAASTRRAGERANAAPEFRTCQLPNPGRSLSDFVVTAARQAAEKAMVQADFVTLSYEDQLRFAHALIDPPPLAPALERAIDRYKRMTGPA